MLTVENGQGLASADSYVSASELAAYAGLSGHLWDAPDDSTVESALRVATRYIDQTYRARFSGERRRRREQALEWPRTNAFGSGDAIKSDEVPRELKEAVCEAAMRQLRKPGSLLPDTREGGAIRSVGADGATVEFAGGGYTGATQFPAIGAAIAPLLMPLQAMFGRTERC